MNRNTTALPVEIWEAITANLPPPKAKVPNMIQIYHGFGSGNFAIMSVSKLITEDELNVFKEIHGNTWKTTQVKYEVNMALGHTARIVMEAKIMGWDFQTDDDRKLYSGIIKKDIRKIDFGFLITLIKD